MNPGTAEPTKTRIVVLARSAGEPIAAQDTVGANIARTIWDNSVFESTWDIGGFACKVVKFNYDFVQNLINTLM